LDQSNHHFPLSIAFDGKYPDLWVLRSPFTIHHQLTTLPWQLKLAHLQTLRQLVGGGDGIVALAMCLRMAMPMILPLISI
jgi:hypothetical protein